MQNPYRLDLSFECQRVTMGAQDAPNAVRFSGVAYSGGVIPRYGYLGDVAIDLASLQNPDAQNLPVLVDHNASIDSIAGKGNLTRAGHALHITGELTQSTEAGRQISALMAEGFPLQLSVGMQASLREVSEPVTINGQTMQVAHVFEQARIVEVSFVPTGADPHTSAAQFSAQPLKPVSPPPEKGVNMTRSAEDQALIDSLQSQITEAQTQLGAMQAAQAAASSARRTADLAALFADIGRDVPSGDAAKPYQAMSDESFAAVAADMRAMQPRHADRTLFASQAAAKAGQKQTPTHGAPERTQTLFAAVQAMGTK